MKFSKMDTLLPIRFILRSSSPKFVLLVNSVIGKIFIFKKYKFANIFIFTLKNNHQKENLKKGKLKKIVYASKLGNTVIDLIKGKMFLFSYFLF